MCGRYTLTVDASVLATLFELEPLFEIEPRYNIAPSQPVPIVRSGIDERPGVGLGPLGSDPFVGQGREDRQQADQRPRRDRRRQTVLPVGLQAPALSSAGRRFLRVGQDRRGGKQPHHIRFTDRRAFAFGGLWERWTPPDGDPIESCTILTTRPNALIARLHDRMPVIMPPERFDDWIGARSAQPRRRRGHAPPPPRRRDGGRAGEQHGELTEERRSAVSRTRRGAGLGLTCGLSVSRRESRV